MESRSKELTQFQVHDRQRSQRRREKKQKKNTHEGKQTGGDNASTVRNTVVRWRLGSREIRFNTHCSVLKWREEDLTCSPETKAAPLHYNTVHILRKPCFLRPETSRTSRTSQLVAPTKHGKSSFCHQATRAGNNSLFTSDKARLSNSFKSQLKTVFLHYSDQ